MLNRPNRFKCRVKFICIFQINLLGGCPYSEEPCSPPVFAVQYFFAKNDEVEIRISISTASTRYFFVLLFQHHWIHDPYLAVTFLTLSAAGKALSTPAYWALSVDMAPPPCGYPLFDYEYIWKCRRGYCTCPDRMAGLLFFRVEPGHLGGGDCHSPGGWSCVSNDQVFEDRLAFDGSINPSALLTIRFVIARMISKGTS